MISIKHYSNTLTLKKEKNISLEITGEDRNIYRVIFYEIEDKSGVENAYCIYDTDTLYNGWSCCESLDLDFDNYPNKVLIQIKGEEGWFADIVYEKKRNLFYRINGIKDDKILSQVRPPIMITGSPGGGTSYITKLLRYRGLYCGTDSGKMESRKNHESITFTSISDIVSFHETKYYVWDDYKDLQMKIRNVNKTPFFYSVLFNDHLKYKFNTFWGDAPLSSLWGWKDPHISITLPIWNKIVPNAKLIIITRSKERLSENIFDEEGDWFRNKASNDSLKLYLDPDVRYLSKDKVFYCNFHKMVKDMTNINEILEWIGLPILKSQEEYINLLKETGYEGKLE